MAGADVLISPHLVDEFTLSLDAIKSFEYLATERPIVATPSSGFQNMKAPGLMIADGPRFIEAVLHSAARPVGGWSGRATTASWEARTRQFGDVLLEVLRRAW